METRRKFREKITKLKDLEENKINEKNDEIKTSNESSNENIIESGLIERTNKKKDKKEEKHMKINVNTISNEKIENNEKSKNEEKNKNDDGINYPSNIIKDNKSKNNNNNDKNKKNNKSNISVKNESFEDSEMYKKKKSREKEDFKSKKRINQIKKSHDFANLDINNNNQEKNNEHITKRNENEETHEKRKKEKELDNNSISKKKNEIEISKNKKKKDTEIYANGSMHKKNILENSIRGKNSCSMTKKKNIDYNNKNDCVDIINNREFTDSKRESNKLLKIEEEMEISDKKEDIEESYKKNEINDYYQENNETDDLNKRKDKLNELYKKDEVTNIIWDGTSNLNKHDEMIHMTKKNDICNINEKDETITIKENQLSLDKMIEFKYENEVNNNINVSRNTNIEEFNNKNKLKNNQNEKKNLTNENAKESKGYESFLNRSIKRRLSQILDNMKKKQIFQMFNNSDDYTSICFENKEENKKLNIENEKNNNVKNGENEDNNNNNNKENENVGELKTNNFSQNINIDIIYNKLHYNFYKNEYEFNDDMFSIFNNIKRIIEFTDNEEEQMNLFNLRTNALKDYENEFYKMLISIRGTKDAKKFITSQKQYNNEEEKYFSKVLISVNKDEKKENKNKVNSNEKIVKNNRTKQNISSKKKESEVKRVIKKEINKNEKSSPLKKSTSNIEKITLCKENNKEMDFSLSINSNLCNIKIDNEIKKENFNETNKNEMNYEINNNLTYNEKNNNKKKINEENKEILKDDINNKKKENTKITKSVVKENKNKKTDIVNKELNKLKEIEINESMNSEKNEKTIEKKNENENENLKEEKKDSLNNDKTGKTEIKRILNQWEKILRDNILKLLKNDSNSFYFKIPVLEDKSISDNIKEEYKMKIKKPMDYTTISKNLYDGIYKRPIDFYSDMKLIYKNCLDFNPGISENQYIIDAAKSSDEKFDNLWNKWKEKIFNNYCDLNNNVFNLSYYLEFFKKITKKKKKYSSIYAMWIDYLISNNIKLSDFCKLRNFKIKELNEKSKSKVDLNDINLKDYKKLNKNNLLFYIFKEEYQNILNLKKEEKITKNADEEEIINKKDIGGKQENNKIKIILRDSKIEQTCGIKLKGKQNNLLTKIFKEKKKKKKNIVFFEENVFDNYLDNKKSCMIRCDKNVFITDCFYYKNIFKNLDEFLDENLKEENIKDILKSETLGNDSNNVENCIHDETSIIPVLNRENEERNENAEGKIINENVSFTQHNNKLDEINNNNNSNCLNKKSEETCNIYSSKYNNKDENDDISSSAHNNVKNEKKLFLNNKKIYFNLKKKEINKIICKEFQDDYEESSSEHSIPHEKTIQEKDSLNDLEKINTKQNFAFNINDQVINNNYINSTSTNNYNINSHSLCSDSFIELNEFKNLNYKKEKSQFCNKRKIHEENTNDTLNNVKKCKNITEINCSEINKLDLNNSNNVETKDNNKDAYNHIKNSDDSVLFNISNKNFFNFNILFEKNKKLKEEFFLKNQIIEKTLLLNLEMEYTKFVDTSFFPVSNTYFYNHYFDDNFFFFIRSRFKLDLFIKIQRKNIFLSQERYFEFLKIHLMNKCRQNSDIKFYLSNYSPNADDTLIQFLEKCFKNLNSDYGTSNSLRLYDAANEISFLLSQIRIYIKEIDILLRLDIDKKTNITTISILKKKLL
ncbi:bromodomain protein, putative [Plasmodium relictum]|uniref:Bromodomain protein, putative n=1 Tax=Plasmodium relictum TaxID=85471 RepID=A0A1J1HC15_PLARL|nr:bromodomain protein, putative [Plasmodium relictum]CRH03041.1 bromodomain protein, putative [Plasmodium relictum]